MTEYTRDEALAFIEAMRLTIQGRVGFRWMSEKLSDLAAYIESVAGENECLHAFLDETSSRGDFESYCETLRDGNPPTRESES